MSRSLNLLHSTHHTAHTTQGPLKVEATARGSQDAGSTDALAPSEQRSPHSNLGDARPRRPARTLSFGPRAEVLPMELSGRDSRVVSPLSFPAAFGAAARQRGRPGPGAQRIPTAEVVPLCAGTQLCPQGRVGIVPLHNLTPGLQRLLVFGGAPTSLSPPPPPQRQWNERERERLDCGTDCRDGVGGDSPETATDKRGAKSQTRSMKPSSGGASPLVWGPRGGRSRGLLP